MKENLPNGIESGRRSDEGAWAATQAKATKAWENCWWGDGPAAARKMASDEI